jgi:hypothetical protein
MSREEKGEVAGVAGIQELENPGAWRRFSQGDAGPEFSDKRPCSRILQLL